ncbi:MAG: hypothetical protein GX838_02400 [Clostridiaceae bacterium]|nr:hypothetical protein [Clostridiaceae bacterium]
MDYLEGFLIGSVWSDTDYMSRRHFSAHIYLATVMAAAFVALVLFPERSGQLILVNWPAAPLLLTLFIILTPILSILYRRLPFFIKPLVLLFYVFKYLLLFYVLVHFFLPAFTIEKESILTVIFARMDSHIEKSLEVIAKSGGILSTVAGVVVGGLWVMGEGLALIGVMILVPLLAIILFKVLQYALDYLVKFLLDGQLAGISPLATTDIPWQGEMDEEEMDGPGVLPVPEKTFPEPASVHKERPDRTRISRRISSCQKVFKEKTTKVMARCGSALGSFGGWFSSSMRQAGARIRRVAGTLQARMKTRPKKQAVRKSGIRLPKVSFKGNRGKEPPETGPEGGT